MADARPLTAWAEWRAYWRLVLIAMLGVVLSSSSGYIIGVAIPPIEREFGWTRAQISSGPMLISITAVLLSTVAGYIIDRFGARRVAIVVVVTMAGSLALIGIAQNLWQWWLFWGIYGVASAATSTVWMAPVTALFHKGRGLALAFATMGTGVSGAIIPPLAEHFVEAGDWRTAFLWIGLVQLAILLPLTLLYWRGAEEFAVARGAGAAADEPPLPELLPGSTVRGGFASPEFYKIVIAYTTGIVSMAGIVINLVPILVSQHVTARQAALVAGSYGLAAIAGRFVGGYALDRFGPKWLAAIPTLLLLLLPLGLLAGGGSLRIAYAVVMVSALLSGVKYPSLIYLVTTYFGARSFGTLFGTISIGGAVGAGVGPLAVSYIYDTTRSYDLALWLAVPGLLVAGLLYASLGPAPDFGVATAGEDAPSAPTPPPVI